MSKAGGQPRDEASESAQAVRGKAELGELVEAIAARVVELLERRDRWPAGRLATAAEVAQEIGVHKSWVYAHADELGAIRLGDGEKARLRFDPERVARAICASRSEPRDRRAGRPRRHGLPTGVRLIEGRSS